MRKGVKKCTTHREWFKGHHRRIAASDAWQRSRFRESTFSSCDGWVTLRGPGNGSGSSDEEWAGVNQCEDIATASHQPSSSSYSALGWDQTKWPRHFMLCTSPSHSQPRRKTINGQKAMYAVCAILQYGPAPPSPIGKKQHNLVSFLEFALFSISNLLSPLPTALEKGAS